MKAWRLDATLTFGDVPDPEPPDGAVVVRLEAAPILSYFRAYVAGTLRHYHRPTGPFTPGTSGVGVVERVGRGVFTLATGQRVLVTGNYTAAENVPDPARGLIGLTSETPAVRDTWRDGTLAEKVVAPVSTVTPVPAGLGDVVAVTRCLVPYGGLLRGRLTPGETVVVNGATGAFGSAGVHVAKALGAARVVAAGRNPAVLERLAALERVVPVRLTGSVPADADALRAAAGGPVDLALDLVGGAVSPDSTLAALAALRRTGRLVLMGSASAPLPIDYTALMLAGTEIIGNFMYPDDAPARLLTLVAAGLLDLGAIPAASFPLAELPAAMDAAAAPGAPLVVVTM
ncbi:quinone oxidoreductase family protein [Cryptosporangium arvum]|uniref:quinone oxidoreductase family protein n=1 Tax=Cryptosporangium arvum TaxID=80871 RepID=UPI0004B27A2C|nr:zinc-binding dehydrogenase [Cryptosporangium arvum]